MGKKITDIFQNTIYEKSNIPVISQDDIDKIKDILNGGNIIAAKKIKNGSKDSFIQTTQSGPQITIKKIYCAGKGGYFNVNGVKLTLKLPSGQNQTYIAAAKRFSMKNFLHRQRRNFFSTRQKNNEYNTNKKNILDESYIMEHTNGPFQKHLKFETDKKIYLLTTLMPGDLKNFISGYLPETLCTSFAVYLLKQLAEQLQALHQQGYAHCDLKPSNILICNEYAYIIDLGLATPMKYGDHKESYTATLGYLAPEGLKEQSLINIAGLDRADIYALGMTILIASTGEEGKKLYNLITDALQRIKGHHLIITSFQRWYDTNTTNDILSVDDEIILKAYLQCAHKLDGRLLPLIMDMIHYDPTKRPTLDIVLERLKHIDISNDEYAIKEYMLNFSKIKAENIASHVSNHKKTWFNFFK